MDLAELKLNDNEFREIRNIVYNSVGINLVESKRALIVSRLARRLRQLQFSYFQDYIRLLERDTDEIMFMINRITTNLTRFYRENNQFHILKQTVLPQLLEEKKKKHEKHLDIWSAGCSTGEEVYTILFEVIEFLKNKVLSSFKLKIYGSDVDTVVLKKAAAAIYSDEETVTLSPHQLEYYFDRLGDKHFRVKDRWRRLVHFDRVNLVHDSYHFTRPLDIIFCRNVVIYFDKETRERCYHKFYQVLNHPGFFFSGHSENLIKHNHHFKLIGKSVYKKVV